MDRRSFLTRLLGAAGAAMVLPQIELLALPPEATTLHDPAWLSTYARVHQEAWRLYRQCLAQDGWPLAGAVDEYPARSIGELLPSGEMMAHWVGVNAARFDGERTIEPAMRCLADAAIRRGIDRYAALPVSRLAGVEYAENIGALRMIVAYDISIDATSVRFDVGGGVSAEGAMRVRRRHQDELKARIRGRLGRYKPLPLPA